MQDIEAAAAVAAAAARLLKEEEAEKHKQIVGITTLILSSFMLLHYSAFDGRSELLIKHPPCKALTPEDLPRPS